MTKNHMMTEEKKRHFGFILTNQRDMVFMTYNVLHVATLLPR